LICPMVTTSLGYGDTIPNSHPESPELSMVSP